MYRSVSLSYNSKTIRFDNQDYMLEAIDLGNPENIIETQERPIGQFYLTNRLDTRIITIKGVCLASRLLDNSYSPATNTMWKRKADLRYICAPFQTWNLHIGSYTLKCYTQRSIEWSQDYESNNDATARFTIEAVALDPCFQVSDILVDPVTYALYFTDKFTIGADKNIIIGEKFPGESKFTITDCGSVPCNFSFKFPNQTITTSKIKIGNMVDGIEHYLIFNVPSTAHGDLYFDTTTFTVRIGSTSLLPYISADSEFFLLQPNNQNDVSLMYSGSGSSWSEFYSDFTEIGVHPRYLSI